MLPDLQRQFPALDWRLVAWKTWVGASASGTVRLYAWADGGSGAYATLFLDPAGDPLRLHAPSVAALAAQVREQVTPQRERTAAALADLDALLAGAERT